MLLEMVELSEFQCDVSLLKNHPLAMGKIAAKSHSWQVLPFSIMSLSLPTVVEKRVTKAYGNCFQPHCNSSNCRNKIKCCNTYQLHRSNNTNFFGQIWESNLGLIVYNKQLYHQTTTFLLIKTTLNPNPNGKLQLCHQDWNLGLLNL